MKETMETNLSFNLHEQLDSLRESGTLTDVILVCGEDKKEISAHKLVLSGTSQYFRTMFSSGSDEYKSGRIELPNIESEVMEIILPFLYKGKFKEVDDISLLKKVLKASRFLQINELFEFCYKTIIPKLDDTCFLDIYNLAEEYDDDGMKAQVVAYLAQNFMKITDSEDFLKLSENQIKMVIQLLGKLDFSMDSLMKGLLRWSEVEVGGENREEILVEIVKTLDLQLISTEFLTELLQLETVKNNHHLLLLLNNAAILCLLTSGNVVKEVAKTGPEAGVKRKSNFSWPIFFLLCAFFGQFLTLFFSKEDYDIRCVVFFKKDNKDVRAYHEVSGNTWSEVKELPFKLDGMSVAMFGGHVYVCDGGSQKILKYSPESNVIVDVGTLEYPVYTPSVAVLGDFIYILCAFDYHLQRCNPLKKTCERLSSLEKKSFGVSLQLFTTSESLYLLALDGGQLGINRYDAVKKQWTLLSYIKLRVESLRIASCEDKLYVVPQETTGDYQVCDTLSQTCNARKFEGGPNEVEHFKAVIIKSKCFLLALDPNNILHKFDVESGQWLDKSSWSIISQIHDFFIIE